jgi:hypothetical protein
MRIKTYGGFQTTKNIYGKSFPLLVVNVSAAYTVMNYIIHNLSLSENSIYHHSFQPRSTACLVTVGLEGCNYTLHFSIKIAVYCKMWFFLRMVCCVFFLHETCACQQERDVKEVPQHVHSQPFLFAVLHQMGQLRYGASSLQSVLVHSSHWVVQVI